MSLSVLRGLCVESSLDKLRNAEIGEIAEIVMQVVVHLSGHLKAFSNGELEVPLDGEFTNVGDALDSLWQRHPALRDRVLNEQGEIRTHVNVFVGSDDVKRLKGLQTCIDSTTELHIFNAVSGG